MARTSQITERQLKRAKELYEDNWTMEEIAQKLSVGRNALWNQVYTYKLWPLRRRGPRVKFDLERMKNLLSEGLSITKTAAKLGVVEATVRYHINKLGLVIVKKQKSEES